MDFLATEYRALVATTREIGEFLVENWRQLCQGGLKSTAGQSLGLVTAADRFADERIRSFLTQYFPGDEILSEEMDEAARANVQNTVSQRRIWIVDPLDGTNNFAHGLDQFAISIALWEGGVPHFGLVYQPTNRTLYWAQRGQGAWCNGARISVDQTRQWTDVLGGVGFYYDRGRRMEATLQIIQALFYRQVQGIRRLGAASLDLCHVAAGRFGFFFELQLAPWDFAAGALVVEEAGGCVSNLAGGSLGLEHQGVVASNGHWQPQVLALIDEYWLRTNSSA